MKAVSWTKRAVDTHKQTNEMSIYGIPVVFLEPKWVWSSGLLLSLSGLHEEITGALGCVPSPLPSALESHGICHFLWSTAFFAGIGQSLGSELSPLVTPCLGLSPAV